MKKEDFLSSDFFKQFKTPEEFNDFFSTLHKRGLEAMLEGELDAHLGYEKHAKTGLSNARNGHGIKTIKTSLGERQVRVPRDRDGSFNPMIVPKRKQMIDGVENVIISLYAKGRSRCVRYTALTSLPARSHASQTASQTISLHGKTDL